MNRLPVSSTVNIDRHHVSISPTLQGVFPSLLFLFSQTSTYLRIYLYIHIHTYAFCAQPRSRQTLDDSSRVALEFRPIEMSVPTKSDHPRRLSKRKRSSPPWHFEEVLVFPSLSSRRSTLQVQKSVVSTDGMDLGRRGSFNAGRRCSFQQQEVVESSKSKTNLRNFYIFFVALFLFIFVAVVYSFIRMVKNQTN